MRDIVSNISVVQMVAPAVQAATVTSEPIDLRGVNSAMVAVTTGAVAGSGNFTAKLQDSDTTTAEDFGDVVAAQLQGAYPASLEANSVAKVGYAGFKRYVRLVITKNSGTSIAAGAVLVAGGAAERPVA